MVLLHRLAQDADRNLTVVHVHHGLRADADQDLNLVRDTCTRLNLNFRPVWIAVRKCNSIQQQARVARYGAIGQICHEVGCLDVVTAHHADDENEACWIAAEEGRARVELETSRPMEHWGMTLHRPLLAYTRAEIQTWAKDHGVVWREDLSNLDPKYRRARLRQQGQGVSRPERPPRPPAALPPTRIGADVVALTSFSADALRQASRLLHGCSISAKACLEAEAAYTASKQVRIRSHGVDIWIGQPIIVHRTLGRNISWFSTSPESLSFAGQMGPKALWATADVASKVFGQKIRDGLRKAHAPLWYRRFGPIGLADESATSQNHLFVSALSGAGLSLDAIDALEF